MKKRLWNYLSPPPKSNISILEKQQDNYITKASLLCGKYKKQRISLIKNSTYKKNAIREKYFEAKVQQQFIECLQQLKYEKWQLKKDNQVQAKYIEDLKYRIQIIQLDLNSKQTLIEKMKKQKSQSQFIVEQQKRTASEINKKLEELQKQKQIAHNEMLNQIGHLKRQIQLKYEDVSLRKLEERCQDKKMKKNLYIFDYEYQNDQNFRNIGIQTAPQKSIEFFLTEQQVLYNRIQQNINNENKLMFRINKLQKWVEKTKSLFTKTFDRLQFYDS